MICWVSGEHHISKSHQEVALRGLRLASTCTTPDALSLASHEDLTEVHACMEVVPKMDEELSLISPSLYHGRVACSLIFCCKRRQP